MLTARVQEKLKDQSGETMLWVSLRLFFIGHFPQPGRKAPAAGSHADGCHVSDAFP